MKGQSVKVPSLTCTIGQLFADKTNVLNQSCIVSFTSSIPDSIVLPDKADLPGFLSFFVNTTGTILYCSNTLSLWGMICRSVCCSDILSADVITINNDSVLTIHSGTVTQPASLATLLRNGASLGRYHHIRLTYAHSQPYYLDVWGICSDHNSRPTAVLEEVLQAIQSNHRIIPFANCPLTQLMEPLLTARTPAVILTDDDSSLPCLLREVLHKKPRGVYSPQTDARMNALRNELFVRENDADAYEDEIRRLRRKIDEQEELIRKLRE